MPVCFDPDELVPSGRNRRNVESGVVGESRGGDSPLAGYWGCAPESSFLLLEKEEDTGGWFGLWQITSASPMRGRHHDAVFRGQVLGRMGVFGRSSLGGWCADMQALRHEIGI